MFISTLSLDTAFRKSANKAFRIPFSVVTNFTAIKTAFRSFVMTFENSLAITKGVNKAFLTTLGLDQLFSRQKAYNVIATFTLNITNQLVRSFPKTFTIWLEPALRFVVSKLIATIIKIVARLGRSSADMFVGAKRTMLPPVLAGMLTMNSYNATKRAASRIVAKLRYTDDIRSSKR
jgi:hypothetical protein